MIDGKQGEAAGIIEKKAEEVTIQVRRSQSDPFRRRCSDLKNIFNSNNYGYFLNLQKIQSMKIERKLLPGFIKFTAA